MTQILMPKATAVWLIDNTGLTFEQISEFCQLHILEVEGIADGDVAESVRGADPISNGQLVREEIEKGEKDPAYRLKTAIVDAVPTSIKKNHGKGPRYTPLSRRQDRPDAIYWLVRNHPELADAQISKLIGTTKPTIKAIRERTHWKINTINPTDPVSLGLCSQIDLDEVVKKAAEKKAREEAKNSRDEGDGLSPVQGNGQDGSTDPTRTGHTLESLFKPSTR